MRARTRDAARNDLAGFSDIALERGEIFVVDLLDVICRESAELLATEKTCHVCAPLPHAHGHVVVIALIAEVIMPAGVFIRGPRHRRGLCDRLVHLDHQAAQHRIAEAERAGQLSEGLLIALDVQEDVVRFVHFGDREGQLTPAPIFEPMHRPAAGSDHAFVAIDHRGDLLALVRMDQKHNSIMSHCISLWFKPPVASGEARNQAGYPAKKSAKDTFKASFGQPARWRKTSNRAIPAATETFRDSICPAIGIRTRKSHFSRVKRRMPLPSPPKTKASGRLKSAE